MLIKSLVIKKDYLTTVNEKATLAEALKVLEDSGYRCVPIVDDTGTIFRGNIYKMHILLSLMKIIIFMVFLLTQECLICCQMRGMLKMVHTF